MIFYQTQALTKTALVIKAFVKKDNNSLLKACKQQGVFNVTPKIVAIDCLKYKY